MRVCRQTKGKKRAATFRSPPCGGGLRGNLLVSGQARDQEIKHGDDTGSGRAEDEAFEAGFVDFRLAVHDFEEG